VVLDEVDSTMAEAARQVRTLSKPTWFLAHKQTVARGRHNRTWLDRKGNFAATLIFRPAASPAEAAKRSFCAANALFEALALYVPHSKLALKWPNDVLLSGGKIAGILLESSSSGPFIDWLSIGIGVNLSHAPTGLNAPFPPVALADVIGEAVPAEEFLTVLANTYATQESKLNTFGFPRIREDWLRNAARLGEEIIARTGKETVRGLFDTVDQDGNLVLITATGPRRITAAEVYF